MRIYHGERVAERMTMYFSQSLHWEAFPSIVAYYVDNFVVRLCGSDSLRTYARWSEWSSEILGDYVPQTGINQNV